MPRSTIASNKAIQKALLKFEKKDLKKVIKRAMRRSVNTFKKPARSKAPVWRGNLRKSVFANAKLAVKFNVLKGAVFSRRKDPYRAYHAHLVEYGTKAHDIHNYMGREGVRVRVGGQRKQPFMKPAFDKKKQPVIRIFKRSLLEAIRHVKARQ